MFGGGTGPGREIDHVGGTGGDDLRDTSQPCGGQARGAGGDDRACKVVVDLLRAQVEDTGEFALRGQIGKGAAAHAGGVKHHGFKAALFQGGDEGDHVGQAGFAQAR